MRSEILLIALAGLASAAPHPQSIDLDAVAAAAAPVIVTPSLAVASQTVSVADISAQAAAASAAVDASPISAALASATAAADKRAAALLARDGTCAAEPAGSGPTIDDPDTPQAFLDSTVLADLALDADTPYGYDLSFQNLQGATTASNYLGLYTLTSYDPAQCQSYCDQASGCLSFNIYAERDPSLVPAEACPDPASTTNLKCTLWGVPITSATATNDGQYQDSFEIVIAASNGYNKNSPPAAITGFTGPTELGGAINAPLDANGYNTYMGYTYYPFSQSQGYTPQTCAAACTATTAQDAASAAGAAYQTCDFFNAYVLSENGLALGLYCSFYNETWSPAYATNYGQTRDGDDYTVSDSYSYSLDA